MYKDIVWESKKAAKDILKTLSNRVTEFWLLFVRNLCELLIKF